MRGRRRKKDYPTPPPTPPGMVYAKRSNGKLELMPADALQRYCQDLYWDFDSLPPEARAIIRELPYQPDEVEIQKIIDKVEANKRFGSLGIGLG